MNCPFCTAELTIKSQEQIWNGASFSIRNNYHCEQCELAFDDAYLRTHQTYTEDWELAFFPTPFARPWDQISKAFFHSSKGVEFLRAIYMNSGLHIRPRTSSTPKEQLRAIARGFGLSPEEAARLLTSSEPHRTYVSQEDLEEHEVRILCDAITERLKERILASR